MIFMGPFQLQTLCDVVYRIKIFYLFFFTNMVQALMTRGIVRNYWRGKKNSLDQCNTTGFSSALKFPQSQKHSLNASIASIQNG